jgi:multiple sugar transport system permease protein
MKRRSPAHAYYNQLLFLSLPFVLGTLVLVLIPALFTAGLAFTDFNAIDPPTWVGLENFTRLTESPLVRLSFYNTAVFIIIAVPLRLLWAFILALLLQAKRPGYGLFRTLVYLPTVIPEAAYALIWIWLFNPFYGPTNILLQALGAEPIAWLAFPETARYAITIMLIFQMGEGFFILLSGLRTIPGSLYEAARVDGAGVWHSFRNITLPIVLPWIMLLTFRDLLVAIQSTFAPSFIMTYGGPYYATMFLPLLIYELSFDFFDLGLAAAIMLLFYLFMGLVIVALINVVPLEDFSEA